MTRTLASGMTTEVAKQQLAPIMFVSMDFQSGFVRAWNGIGTISWSGYDWVGGGQFMAISSIEETQSVEATAINLTLSGVPSAMVAIAYADYSQGRAVRVYLGMMNVSAGTIISDPIQIFAGRMDLIGDSDDGNTATITVTAESNLADLDRVRVRYYTDQDQQRIFEADRSLRYMSSIQDRPVYWGVAAAIGQPTPTNL